jgi:hypothetical protein
VQFFNGIPTGAFVLRRKEGGGEETLAEALERRPFEAQNLGFGQQCIYMLTKDAISRNAKPGQQTRIPWNNRVPKPMFFAHELLLRDFRALLLAKSIKELPGGVIKNCSINSYALGFGGPYGRILRDGYFEVQSTSGGVSSFSFEVDRGTEAHSIIAARILGYRYLLKSGMFAKRKGHQLITVGTMNTLLVHKCTCRLFRDFGRE